MGFRVYEGFAFRDLRGVGGGGGGRSGIGFFKGLPRSMGECMFGALATGIPRYENPAGCRVQVVGFQGFWIQGFRM